MLGFSNTASRLLRYFWAFLAISLCTGCGQHNVFTQHSAIVTQNGSNMGQYNGNWLLVFQQSPSRFVELAFHSDVPISFDSVTPSDNMKDLINLLKTNFRTSDTNSINCEPIRIFDMCNIFIYYERDNEKIWAGYYPFYLYNISSDEVLIVPIDYDQIEKSIYNKNIEGYPFNIGLIEKNFFITSDNETMFKFFRHSYSFNNFETLMGIWQPTKSINSLFWDHSLFVFALRRNPLDRRTIESRLGSVLEFKSILEKTIHQASIAHSPTHYMSSSLYCGNAAATLQEYSIINPIFQFLVGDAVNNLLKLANLEARIAAIGDPSFSFDDWINAVDSSFSSYQYFSSPDNSTKDSADTALKLLRSMVRAYDWYSKADELEKEKNSHGHILRELQYTLHNVKSFEELYRNALVINETSDP